jgi:uncharacterized protein (TIGR02186 family)
MSLRWAVAVTLLAAVAGRAACPAHGAETGPGPVISLQVSERSIQITPRYRGELIKVSGTVPAHCDVVLKLTSSRAVATFSLLGKVGPLWLSRGRVRFANVPQMFKIKSTRPLQEILLPGELMRHGLGFSGLRASITVEGGLDPKLYLNELLAVRQAAELYTLEDTGIASVDGHFAATFFWPPGAASGTYRIEALAVRDLKVVDVRETTVEVHKVGIEAWISDLAYRHGILYGLLAVGLAVAVAFVMSGVFNRIRGKEPVAAGQEGPRQPADW